MHNMRWEPNSANLLWAGKKGAGEEMKLEPRGGGCLFKVKGETEETSSRPVTPAGLWILTWNCLMAGLRHLLAAITWTFMIWMEWARARWRAPISRSDRRETWFESLWWDPCVSKPCDPRECRGCTHSTAWRLQRWSGLCTLCTCCEFHYENHSAARYQNSLPSGASSRGPEPGNSSRALVPPFLIYTDRAEAQVFQVTLHITFKLVAFWNPAGTKHRAPPPHMLDNHTPLFQDSFILTI